MKPFASLRILAIAFLGLICALAPCQSLPFAPSIPVNVTIYGNLHTHQMGPVITKRLDSFHHLGLDLDGLLGVTANSTTTPVGSKFSNFAGLVGVGLSMSATWPKTAWYVQGGLSVTWNSGTGVGAGPYGLLGKRF